MTTARPYHRIKRLRVSAGFLAGLDLELADGLNCFIGGRGAGKTTALEFLRYGLGFMPDAKTSASRLRTIEGLVKENLAGGRIDIEVETRTAMSYKVGRGYGETVQVINEQGVAIPTQLDRDQIFSADVFSQNEIEEIAADPKAQLELLDRFKDAESARIARDIETVQSQLRSSGEALLALDREIEEVSGRALELPVLEERLKGLTTGHGPDAPAIAAAHEQKQRRIAEAAYAATVANAAEKATREVVAAAAGFDVAIESSVGGNGYESDNAALIAQMQREAAAFKTTLESVMRSVNTALDLLRPRVVEIDGKLRLRHAEQEVEYRALLEKLQEEGGRAAARLQLQSDVAAAQTAVREKDAKDKQRELLRQERGVLMSRLSELRDERFALRRRVAAELTQQFDGALRITVMQGSDDGAYRELVGESLRGVVPRHGVAAERIAESMVPAELAVIVRERGADRLAAQTGFEADRARKVVDALGRDGAYILECVELADRPIIQLRHGETFKDSTHLSTGQRCTTVLPILLLQNERPLLIDQPEDNLDNAFVFETIVTALTRVRGKRQVIFVTHNPNIPVLGEAERVFVFNSDGETAVVEHAGTVDDCKDEIERILEGGKEAFLRRKERYGH